MQTDPNTRDRLWIMRLMAMEPISGQMVECILDSGRRIKCMVMDKYLGKMGENILAYYIFL